MSLISAHTDAHGKREVTDLRVTVVAEPVPTGDCYRIEVRNRGAMSYESLTVTYRDLLLWAERFGLDTTHMPAQEQYAAEVPVRIDRLGPGEAAQFLRRGYGEHHHYDGPRLAETPLSFAVGDRVTTAINGCWCRAEVLLPGAR